ncbi:hypothetical protein STSO111631_21815 [Stackebrandtia soli]
MGPRFGINESGGRRLTASPRHRRRTVHHTPEALTRDPSTPWNPLVSRRCTTNAADPRRAAAFVVVFGRAYFAPYGSRSADSMSLRMSLFGLAPMRLPIGSPFLNSMSVGTLMTW